MVKIKINQKLVAQSLQLISLLCYLLLLIFIFKEERSLELVVSVFGVGIVLDQLAHYFFNRRMRNPIPSLITSCAVVILMTTHFNLWPYLLALTVGLLSKYIIRKDGGHVFNPACFGLFFVVLIFSEQAQIKFSQWLPSSTQLFLLLLFGSIVVIVAKRFWVAISYFCSILLLTSIYGWFTPELPFPFLIGTLFSFSVTLFAFHMITDPATTPGPFPQQIVFGASVGSLDFMIRRLEEPYAPFFALLFVSAFWNFRDELGRWISLKVPSLRVSSLVLLLLCCGRPTEAANICSRSKEIIQVLEPKNCADFDLTRVKSLDLGGLGLEALSEEDISGFKQLRHLDLSQNKLTELPLEVGHLKNLEHLDIGNNLFKEYPEAIKNLNSLKFLDVSYNLLERVDHVTNPNLEEVSLFHNNIKTFPESLTMLKRLRVLNLGFNYIEQIPDKVSAWSQLESIIFNYNKLEKLPGGVASWKNIKVVDFHRNLLKSIPDAVGSWKNTEVIDFSENKIQKIPKSVGSWTKAHSINFSNNDINRLPKAVGRWKSMVDLDVSHNQLKALPDSAGSWKNIALLNMSYNNISTLPDETRLWKRLIHFSIHHNRLSKLPRFVGQWNSIRKLELYNNFLETLPESAGDWKHIKEIDLRYNRIKRLPKKSKLWFSLEKLMIVGNPQIRLPKGLPPGSVIY